MREGGTELKRVAIIHPWFPQYRREFFEGLVETAHRNGVHVDIFYGTPPPEWGERGDSSSANYAIQLSTRFIRVGKKSFALKSLSEIKKRGPYDAIVLEQAIRNLETYRLLLPWQRFAAKVAFWGHGRTYTAEVSPSQERLKLYLTSYASWFFAYTDGGAKAVIDNGFDRSRITVVRNSVDTKKIRAAVLQVDESQKEAFRLKHQLTNKVAIFVGGLDAAKRIGFLLAAAEHAYGLDSEFRLVVVGSGSERGVVQQAAKEYPWLVYLGPLFDGEKAEALSVASLMLMPGRVGLVALDSFAAGVPIVTTDWPWHAPEFEYLTNGRDSVITADDIYEYAAQIVGVLNDRDRLSALREGAKAAMDQFSVEQMVSNFWNGLQQLLR